MSRAAKFCEDLHLPAIAKVQYARIRKRTLFCNSPFSLNFYHLVTVKAHGRIQRAASKIIRQRMSRRRLESILMIILNLLK